ncbi:GNAT family N-acetyltransferase [Roseibium sediminicola]|uniref:GNAT family N-acetyltransferase n=1 Tax=Roseibium sediminicola TaxID=2933272 RepID=A0ABT0H085_9HYPH|nr:GNAT family N-acetyltransferase [Roseibium sp. CAU 1639]MCK7614697.1 GNAT family N-acetyltransferase [Roseibium sp. CAU 1639]
MAAPEQDGQTCNMCSKPSGEIEFRRLTDIAPEILLAHMSDPRVGEHLPLQTFTWDLDMVEKFVAAKEACWQCDGLGHWAIFCGGSYVGWGGFQKEDTEWDFGLVLTPDAFGLGARIARQALAFARADTRIPFVTFLLAPTRKNLGALTRLGAKPLGTVEHAGTAFLKFRLETA